MRLLLDAIARVAGVSSPATLDLRALFAAAPRAYHGSGVPRPWLFLRAGILALCIQGLLLLAWDQTGNRNLLPALIFVGSTAAPMVTVLLCFECNVRRNVSLYAVSWLALLGGVLALLTALLLYRLSDLLHLAWLGPALPALVEEPAKLLGLVLVAGNLRWRGRLNGLLFGAAVGAGFSALESAGFAFRTALVEGAPAMQEVIFQRGLLAPFSHVAWSAAVAAALWRVRGPRPFTAGMLLDASFLRVSGLVLLLHCAWDAGGLLPWPVVYPALGFIAWVVLAGFMVEELRDLRLEQGSILNPT